MMTDTYIGVKLINAISMNRQSYNDLRGWKLPDDENGNDEGFLVEYVDGGKPNVKGFTGYVSWSPEEIFNNAYTKTTGMSFEIVLELIKNKITLMWGK